MRAPPGHVVVVGAGWAGCAAAVEAQRMGWHVSLIEAARQPGGRARSVALTDTLTMDNGQHILIGAYTRCLQLMQQVGVDAAQLLHRAPLDLRSQRSRARGRQRLKELPALHAAIESQHPPGRWPGRDPMVN